MHIHRSFGCINDEWILLGKTESLLSKCDSLLYLPAPGDGWHCEQKHDRYLMHKDLLKIFKASRVKCNRRNYLKCIHAWDRIRYHIPPELHPSVYLIGHIQGVKTWMVGVQFCILMKYIFVWMTSRPTWEETLQYNLLYYTIVVQFLDSNVFSYRSIYSSMVQ